MPPRSSRTTTYSGLAARLGTPRAARAVAAACAANPVAVAVPCHRAVRRDGSPSGFRWGLARKRALLERESRAQASASTHPVSAIQGRERRMGTPVPGA